MVVLVGIFFIVLALYLVVKFLHSLSLNVSISDINECLLNISGCSQNCTNTIGSYNCSCYSGYQFDADLMSCNGRYLLSFFH